MRNTTYYPRRERQTVAKKNTDSHNGSSEKENLFTNRASTVLKFQATYSSTDSYDDLPELVHVEMEQEWIEEKLPEVAQDLNSGFPVVHYQINNHLSVTIHKAGVLMNSPSYNAS